MFNVHPPHHAVHAWRDFFIHIATIVIGLLIGIGLDIHPSRTITRFQ